MSAVAMGSARTWSTDFVPSRSALDYWVATVCDHVLEMQIESPAHQSFWGELSQSRLGVCGISMIEAEGQEILRTRAMIGRSRFSDFRLLYFRAGGGTVAQRGRIADVATGDCVLLDSTETYALKFPQRTACTVLSLPREWLCGWIRSPEALVARPIDVRAGWGSALSAWMRCIEPEALKQVSLPATVLSEQVVALLAMAGNEPVNVNRAERNPLYTRLLATLKERCGETSLTPQVVAEEHRISRRYLHMLFHRAGTTFCDALMNARLEQAFRLLSDQRFSDLPVGEVAARCGFAEPSHFARRFKDSYGMSPKSFRGNIKTAADA